MFGEVFEDSERRYGKDLLFVHDAHGLVGKLIGVIDRRHASPRRIERARLAVA